MFEEHVKEGAEAFVEGEEMFVIFGTRAWYAEEGLPGDALEKEAPETPDVKSIVSRPRENHLGSSKAKWS